MHDSYCVYSLSHSAMVEISVMLISTFLLCDILLLLFLLLFLYMFNIFLYVYGPCVCNKDILLLLLYKYLKPVYSMENYLKCNYHRDLRQYLTKLRLSSHKFLVEMGRWVITEDYHEKLCTLCDENDIEDEYHILMKCNYFVNLREKYISKKYYKRPSMYKFQKLIVISSKTS